MTKVQLSEEEIKALIATDINRYRAICILKVRDNIAQNDYNEAYHWLYAIASPHFDKYEPWEELEKIASGQAVDTPSPSGSLEEVAAEIRARLGKFGYPLHEDALTIIQSVLAGAAYGKGGEEK